MKKSIFEQVLTYKSYDFMFGSVGNALIDHALESGEEGIKKHFKNVCAPLSLPLIARLENTLSTLHMSKREFFELAIIEALDKADEIMKDVGVDDYLEDLALRQSESEAAA